ncbi:unnamed protein product [Euphydryas editha]|uniref:Uncharacterized protein n=1 Tax=Euphydryas editha TaxID=104508 RepID=A0AAU9TLC8_EUPED|nr:unnamed protein product [Euphydryas editha]
MDLLKVSKIFLVCFTILSGCIRESKSTELNEITDKKAKEADAVNSFACHCFPENPKGKHISELIAPSGVDQRRLVVYIYKTNNTDFTIYVPNKEKQRIFPDLTFDAGDNLQSLNTEKVNDLYEINSDVTINNVPKEVKKQEDIDGILQTDVQFPSRNPTDLWTTLPYDIIFGTSQNDHENVVDQAGIHFVKQYPSTSDLFYPGELPVFSSAPGQISVSETNTRYPSINDLVLNGDQNMFPPAAGEIDVSKINKNQQNINDLTLNGDMNVVPPAAGKITVSEINKNQASINDLPVNGDLNVFPPAAGQISVSEINKNLPIINDLLLHGDQNMFPFAAGQISVSETNTNEPSISDSSLQEHLLVFPSAPGQISVPGINTNQPSITDYFLNEDLNMFPSAPGQISASEINTIYPSFSDLFFPGDLLVFPSEPGKISLSETNIKYPSVNDFPLHGDLNAFPPAAEQFTVSEININQPSIGNTPLNEGMDAIPLKTEHSLSQTSTNYLGSSEYNQVIPIPPERFTLSKLEKWFKGDKNFIGNIKLPFLQMINQGQFIIILLKALHENGINLSESGDLIDWNGNTLDMSKLKLIPIILGDVIDYKNLVGQNKCFTPYDLSFLQAILITLAYPPRILSVIPLGRILEETAHYTNQPCELDPNKKVISCKGGSCQIKTVKDEDATEASDKTELLSSDKGGLLNNLNLKLNNNNFLDLMLPHSAIKGIIKNTNPIKEVEEDELLGLRIIGGQPATSSGTPVSSRGRSGDVV